MRNEKARDIIKQYIRYGIIASLVVIALVILPLISTDLGVGWQLPTSPLGWISYVVLRGLVGVITFLIFVSFDSQAEVNVASDERYIKAYKKLYDSRDKNYIPLSPAKRKLKAYGMKAITLSLSSIITAFVVIQCVLSYNYNILLAYALSIFFALVFGVVQMLSVERYWTEEFPIWVDYYLDEVNKNNDKIQQ